MNADSPFPINRLEPTNFFGGQSSAQNYSALRQRLQSNQEHTRKGNVDLLSKQLGSQDIGPLVKQLADQLKIPELTAFKLIRKFMGTGQAGSLSELKGFLTEFLKDPATEAASKSKYYLALRQAKVDGKTDAELEKTFRPIIRDLQDKFVQQQLVRQKFQTNRPGHDSFVSIKRQPPPRNLNQNDLTHLTKLVSSPKEFASWLVNNKAAFIALKANPAVTNIVIAMQNPQLQESPALLTQLVNLLVQVLKLKAGRSPARDIDEKKKFERDQETMQEIQEHDSNIVNSVKETVETVAINPLREFLIEAERFAEEEVANLWSLTLKNEKELEKQKNIHDKEQ